MVSVVLDSELTPVKERNLILTSGSLQSVREEVYFKQMNTQLLNHKLRCVR